MRYCTLIKWHSQLACLIAMNPTGFIMLDHYQYPHSCTRDEGDKAAERQTIALIAVHSINSKLSNLHYDFAKVDRKQLAPLRSEMPYKSPRGEGGAPAPAPTSPLKRLIVPVDKQFKILGFNLLNTYSKCSGNFVAAVSKIYLKLLESN